MWQAYWAWAGVPSRTAIAMREGKLNISMLPTFYCLHSYGDRDMMQYYVSTQLRSKTNVIV